MTPQNTEKNKMFLLLTFSSAAAMNTQNSLRTLAGVDAILNQIIETNDCVSINVGFLAALLNYLIEHNQRKEKK